MTRDDIIDRVRELALPAGEWAVHASGSMVMHGLLPEANDLDILARGTAWDTALDLGTPVAGRHDLVVRYGPDVEIWSGWYEEGVDELIDSAQLVDGVPVVPLSAVLRFKERLGRPKDLAHIDLLRARIDAAAGGSSR